MCAACGQSSGAHPEVRGVSFRFVNLRKTLSLDLSNSNLNGMSVFAAENKGVNSQRLVACITTLYLFSKIRAQLMVKHAMTMQPYLTTKCHVSQEQEI